jgi:hypothetical protein
LKALEVALLIVGVSYGILGIVYLAFRWQPSWLGRGRAWSFGQGIMDIFFSVFAISVALPKIANWRGATASALAVTATVSFLLFVGFRLAFHFAPSIAKRHREHSILPPSS